jgi:hypothetical protein
MLPPRTPVLEVPPQQEPDRGDDQDDDHDADRAAVGVGISPPGAQHRNESSMSRIADGVNPGYDRAAP